MVLWGTSIPQFTKLIVSRWGVYYAYPVPSDTVKYHFRLPVIIRFTSAIMVATVLVG